MNKQYYEIYKLLKQLGFKSSNHGTKLLIKVIIEANKTNEEYKLVDIYSVISESTKLTSNNIKKLIFYAINSRNKALSKKNFEKIFGYEYDENLFVCKELVEYIVEIINIAE